MLCHYIIYKVYNYSQLVIFGESVNLVRFRLIFNKTSSYWQIFQFYRFHRPTKRFYHVNWSLKSFQELLKTQIFSYLVAAQKHFRISYFESWNLFRHATISSFQANLSPATHVFIKAPELSYTYFWNFPPLLYEKYRNQSRAGPGRYSWQSVVKKNIGILTKIEWGLNFCVRTCWRCWLQEKYTL